MPYGSYGAADLTWNFAEVPRVQFSCIWNNHYADSDMENVEKFRQYAAECRRLAQRASGKDREVLIEIAEAWTACAEEVARKEKSGEKAE
jgi:hypothetical protein